MEDTVPPREQAYTALLKYGLEFVKQFAEAGKIDLCRIEAVHLHNIPTLLHEDNEHRHEYYIRGERAYYLDQLKELGAIEHLGNVATYYSEPWRILAETVNCDPGPGAAPKNADTYSTNVRRPWRALTVPYIGERVIGFSIPQDDTMLVVSYDGMYLVRFGPPIVVETDIKRSQYDLYDPAAGVCRYQEMEWSIIGLHADRPLVEGRDGERLELDAAKRTLSVVKKGRPIWSTVFENSSGDWAVATFSPDSRFIVLGCPYGFDFQIWMRTDTKLR